MASPPPSSPLIVERAITWPWLMVAVVQVGCLNPQDGVQLVGAVAVAARAIWVWNSMASATMAVVSSGTSTSVVLVSSPGRSMHAYSGSSWCSDGRLRAKVVRFSLNGPGPLRTPLTSCSSALSDPRCGVPSVISLRETSAPPRRSRYQRATRPPSIGR